MDAGEKHYMSHLHEETRTIWERNAAFWDEKMGEGNAFQTLLVGPASERLLNVQPGEEVLEIACGNGVFARRMARLGAQVVATDFSASLLELARARSSDYAGRIGYRLLDATREDEILALGTRRFDAAVCNMGIMDMSEIDPLMRGIRQVLKPAGRFVFTLCHPCFNHTGMSLTAEEATVDGELVASYAVKITKYLHKDPQKGVAIVGQPLAQYYFDRPLHVLFNACFRAGLVIDGLEEPAFDPPAENAQARPTLSWSNYWQIPPVLAVRARVARY